MGCRPISDIIHNYYYINFIVLTKYIFLGTNVVGVTIEFVNNVNTILKYHTPSSHNRKQDKMMTREAYSIMFVLHVIGL